MKKLFFGIYTIFFFNLLFSQTLNISQVDTNSYSSIFGYEKDIYKSNVNFFDVQSKMQNVLASFDSTQNMYPLKKYYRFEYFWNTRASSNPNQIGNFSDYNEIMNNYSLSIPECNSYQNNINWENIGANFITKYISSSDLGTHNGIITAVYMNPSNTDEILAGTNTSGIFRTIDRGVTWECVTDNNNIPGIGISHFAINPLNSNTIIASTGKSTYNEQYGTGILISYNSGQTWSKVQNFPNSDYDVAKKTIISPQDTNSFYTLTTKKLLFSPNHGQTWFTLFDLDVNNGYVNTIYQKLNDFIITDNGIFLGGSKIYDGYSQIWKSSGSAFNMTWQDIGQNFENLSNLNLNEIEEVKFTEVINDRFYVYISANSTSYFFKTIDDGGTFSFYNQNYYASEGSGKIGLSQTLAGDRIYTGVVSPTVVTQNNSGFVMSTQVMNYTWHDDLRCSQILIDNQNGKEYWVVGNDGGISVFDIDQASAPPFFNNVEVVTYPLRINQLYDLAISQFDDNPVTDNDNISIIGGTQDNAYVDLNNLTNNWYHAGAGDGGNCWLSCDGTRHQKVTASASMIINSSLNGVSNINLPNFSLNTAIQVNEKKDALYYTSKYYIDDADQSHNLELIKIDDNFAQSLSIPDNELRNISEIALCESNENVVYFAGGNPMSGSTDGQTLDKFFKSVDDLQSYVNLSSSTVYNSSGGNPYPLNVVLSWKKITAICVNPNNSDELWIGISSVAKDDWLEHQKYRLLHSTNGGETWYDHSEGLPGLPVNCIEYVKGTNDIMLIGTDVGVYYGFGNGNQGPFWNCYFGDMPYTIVTGIEIDYCDKKIYTSTYGRGVWQTDLNFNISSEYPELIVYDNLSIEETYNCVSSIIIKPGATMEVTGTLYMNEGTKIIVEPGGYLRVNGGTITNGCDGFWEGIEVRGVASDLTQDYNTQGRVYVYNNATIEHANTAIKNFGISANGHADMASTGGIITVEHSTFVNNKRAVEFYPYQRTVNGLIYYDKSSFYNTDFIWDDNFRTEKPLGHITMYKVHGIKIRECNFKDDRTHPASLWIGSNNKNRSGIITADSYFWAIGCEFSNLDFGIWAQDYHTEKTVTVKNSVFTNNLYGIELVKIGYPTCQSNNFIFNGNHNFQGYPSWSLTGIHAISTNQIRFEENSFDGFGAGNKTVGILCSNLGPVETQTYRNNYVNMRYSTVTQGLNRNDETGQGLQFQCNTNDNTLWRDHYILGTLWGTPNSAYGVKSIFNVGTNASPKGMGNTFSQNGTALNFIEDFDNLSTQSIDYVYYVSGLNEEPIEFSNFSKIPTINNNTCPTHIKTGGGTKPYINLTATEKTQYVYDFYTYTNTLTQKQQTLDSLIDGGNTDSLMTLIATALPNQKHTLRQTLLSYSPYLTEEVIRFAIDRPSNKFPNLWGAELIMANIDVMREPGFKDFLLTKQNPMPPGIINMIETYLQTQTYSDKFIKEAEISGLYYQIAFAADMIIEDFKQDTNGVEIDSVLSWTEIKNDLNADIRLIDLYLEKGEYEKAQLVMNSIVVDNYPDYLKDEIKDLLELKTKIKAILVKNGSLANMSKEDQIYFRKFAETSVGSAQAQAQGILCFFFDECIAEQLILPDNSTSKQMEIDKVEPIQKEFEFKLYPNPANQWVAVELPLNIFETNETVNISIIDLNGKIVFQTNTSIPLYIWETTDLDAGTYLVNVSLSNGEQIGSQKVIVNH